MAFCSSIAGVSRLWRQTTGAASTTVALLDGPVRSDHECFKRSDLDLRDCESFSPQGPAIRHGTFIASLLFADYASPLPGLVPGCRALSIPLFRDYGPTKLSHCSQLQLAESILRAARRGAQIINVSAGQFVANERQLESQLAEALEECQRRGILVVSAAGNDGCQCHRVPATFPTVLAVGAHANDGAPLQMSNWGSAYSNHAILAPGQNFTGALATGGYCIESGTSIATAIVTGVCALLLDVAILHGSRYRPIDIGEIVRCTAAPCQIDHHRRCLDGRLNIPSALATILKGAPIVSQGISLIEPQTSDTSADEIPAAPLIVERDSSQSDGIFAPQFLEPQCGCAKSSDKLACSCSTAAPAVKLLREVYTGAPALQKVFALGRLSFDFPDDARRDAVVQMLGFPVEDRKRLATALKLEPQKAESILWTIEVEGKIPVCALQPQGPFAREQYERILEFFDQQENGNADRAAVPGFIIGEVFAVNSARILPLIAPDLEGMRNMNLEALLEVARQSVQPDEPEARAPKDERQQYQQTIQELDAQFARIRVSSIEALSLLYDENTGLAVISGDRARAFMTIDFGPVLSQMFGAALQGKTLEFTAAGPSRDTPTGRDYQDVTLSFFNPSNTDEANVNVTFVIDVTDVKPRVVVVRPLRRTRGPLAFRRF